MVTRRTQRLVKRALLWGGVVVLVSISGLIAHSTWEVYGKMVTVKAERLEAEEERELLRARTEELSASLKLLSTDRGIEEEIRSRYPLVKPGEVEIVLMERPGAEAPPVVPVEPSFWGTVRSFIGL
ncbi:MAG: septum formation initiator family protein [Candidatus Pacebacteria bacterium]|nr:septum formation initiator family protein [Candidatus Paceibacterota bacterium]